MSSSRFQISPVAPNEGSHSTSAWLKYSKYITNTRGWLTFIMFDPKLFWPKRQNLIYSLHLQVSATSPRQRWLWHESVATIFNNNRYLHYAVVTREKHRVPVHQPQVCSSVFAIFSPLPLVNRKKFTDPLNWGTRRKNAAVEDIGSSFKS